MDTERHEFLKNTYETPAQHVEGYVLGADELVRKEKEEGSIVDSVNEHRREAARVARTEQYMKDALLVRVESILSDNLAAEYVTLPKEKQDVFRQEGEELAVWLHDALESGAVKPHKILTRIERWLLIIEGKNRHSPWLLQEAYVRTRRIVREEMYNHLGH